MAISKSAKGLKCPSPWIDEQRGYFVDWLTQLWVKAARRKIRREDRWLFGPAGHPRIIGADYYSQLAVSESLDQLPPGQGIGLVEEMSTLLDTASLDPRIVHFYEHTSQYDLRIDSRWCGLFFPFGWLIALVFSRRLQQLNVPLSCRRKESSLTSEIIGLADSSGKRVYTGWLRTSPARNTVVYAGLYGHTILPSGKPALKVTFPLPNGNATVIMDARVGDDGSLFLNADGHRYGESGFYFVVREAEDRAAIRLVRSVREQIHVYGSGENLAADHTFRLFGLVCFQLHYEMALKAGSV